MAPSDYLGPSYWNACNKNLTKDDTNKVQENVSATQQCGAGFGGGGRSGGGGGGSGGGGGGDTTVLE